eukprot:1763-Heterococcus_DN1.PRE.1
MTAHCCKQCKQHVTRAGAHHRGNLLLHTAGPAFPTVQLQQHTVTRSSFSITASLLLVHQ